MLSSAYYSKEKNNLYLFLEQLSDPVIYICRDGKVQYSNHAAGNLFGQQSLDLFADLCKEKQEFLIEVRSWTQPFNYLLFSGEYIVLEIHITVLQADDGSPDGFIIICKNLQRPSVSVHHQLQPHFEAFMKHLPALAWITDEQFVLHYFNEEFKRLFEISDEKVGYSFDQVFPYLSTEAYKKNNDLVFSTNESVETIEELFNGRGEKCIYKVYRFPINTISKNRLLGAIAIDLTNQIRQQQELTASYERFTYVSKATSDAIWDWDIIADKVYRGEVYSKLLGINAINFSMEQHFQSIHIKDRKKVKRSLEATLGSAKDYWQEEYRFVDMVGNFHDIIDKGFIVRNETGIAVRMIGAMEDVSQNRRLEKVLIEKEEAKKKEIIKAIIEAQEKERTQISYELHEQLSQNLATCKLLLDGLHFPEAREEEKIRIRSSMKLLTQTMNEIRSMSHQLNANAIKMVGLVGVMRDVTSTVNQNWQVEVMLQCDGFSDATILPKEIEVSAFRIFQEGMNNVIRHSGATHATVQLTKKQKWLRLSITDNGKGFKINTTPKGLGFTNIINRVEYHNGTVSIESSEGNGCTLEVKLPIVEKNWEG